MVPQVYCDILPQVYYVIHWQVYDAFLWQVYCVYLGSRAPSNTSLLSVFYVHRFHISRYDERQMAEQGLRYLTLDDELTLLSAREDPVGMIRSLDRAVIDEIQRAPQLLLAIKKSVDEDRRPGRFLLTGSANLMALPTVADSLAGRMATLSLLPLSQSEIHGNGANWIDAAFAGRLLKVDAPLLGEALVEAVLRGGYPEAITRATARRRTAWARQYIDAIIQRDIRDVGQH